jgi:cyclase
MRVLPTAWRSCLFGLILAASPGASGAAPQALPLPAAVKMVGPAPKITRTQVSDGVYQFTVDDDGFDHDVNSVAIVNADDVLVFDTDTRPSVARAVLAQIRQITPKPVRFVVNSHWHPDHWSGNQVYAEAFPGLQIIASEESRTYMLNMAAVWPVVMPQRLARSVKQIDAEMASGKTTSGDPLSAKQRADDADHLLRQRDMTAEMTTLSRVYPNLTYRDEMHFYHGGREFRFMSVTGDALGSTVLYMPRERILIAGDTVVYPLPSYTPPLSRQAQSLRALLRLDFDTVIPGHGPVEHDKSYMTLEADLFENIVSQVIAAFRNGKVTVEEVQAAVQIDPALRARFTHGDSELEEAFPQLVTGLALKAYTEGRDSREFH